MANKKIVFTNKQKYETAVEKEEQLIEKEKEKIDDLQEQLKQLKLLQKSIGGTKKKTSNKKSKEPDLSLEWDLDAILEGGTLEELYDKWLKGMDKSIELYPTFLDSLDNFKQWINHGKELRIISNRLSNYVSNNYNSDVSNPQWIGMSQKMSIDGNKLTVALADYENRILDNETKVLDYLKDPEIKEYTRSFDHILKMKPHTLSKTEETLLARISKSDGGVEEMYDSLTTSDIKFADAIDSNGKKHPIKTQSEVFVNLKSRDRSIRKTSWLNFHNAFYEVRSTLSHAIYYNYLMLNTDSEIRNFKNYIDAVCFGDEVEVKLIPHIYEQVATYKDIHKEYVTHRSELLKQMLNLKELEPWDANVDLINKKTKFTPEQGKKIVLEALAPLGKEYTDNVQKAFNERWISWMPRPGKYTGAYSIGGTKGLSKYYILMNWDNTLGSISTLIHEMGHSMNSYYYSKAQSVYASTSIFTAEVASITNEMLLNYYLLEKYKNDDAMKLMILDEMISGFFATTSRQIIFSNFEWIINEKVNNNESVTFEVIEKVYGDLQSKYMYQKDPTKQWKEPYRKALVTPLRISHFFAGNFYVYKYAIGQIVACIVASRIINKTPGMLEKYYEFLKSGTSRSPIDTIKLLDIDLYKPEPWQEAKQIMAKFIKQFKSFKKI